MANAVYIEHLTTNWKWTMALWTCCCIRQTSGSKNHDNDAMKKGATWAAMQNTLIENLKYFCGSAQQNEMLHGSIVVISENRFGNLFFLSPFLSVASRSQNKFRHRKQKFVSLRGSCIMCCFRFGNRNFPHWFFISSSPHSMAIRCRLYRPDYARYTTMQLGTTCWKLIIIVNIISVRLNAIADGRLSTRPSFSSPPPTAYSILQVYHRYYYITLGFGEIKKSHYRRMHTCGGSNISPCMCRHRSIQDVPIE